MKQLKIPGCSKKEQPIPVCFKLFAKRSFYEKLLPEKKEYAIIPTYYLL